MRSNQERSGWMNFLDNCKQKWTKFWRGLFLSVVDEEMKIRREECDKQAESSFGPIDQSTKH